MNPYLFKEKKAIKIPKYTFFNIIVIILLLKLTGIISMNLMVSNLIVYSLYSTSGFILFSQDGIENVYIFLAGNSILKNTHYRLLARYIILTIGMFPSIICLILIANYNYWVYFLLSVVLAYVNTICVVGLRYRIKHKIVVSALSAIFPLAVMYIISSPTININKTVLLFSILLIGISVSKITLMGVKLEHVITAQK